jgi:transcriptional regulator with XRE-family HTH domain
VTIKDAADDTGFSPSAISDFEYGRRDISLTQLEVLAHIYRVPITYFWSDDPIPHEEDLGLPIAEAMELRRRIIGVLLRQARMDAGLSQKDLAGVLDCPSGRISSYELGRTDIPLVELEKLANYLEVPLSYFLDQGIRPSGDQVAGTDELERLAQLPEDVRKFMLEPGNLLYVRVAMRLSDLSAETLRNVAEGLLDITY